MDPDGRVFVIDDDPSVLSSLQRLLRAHGLHVEVFASPADFLGRPPYDGIGCLLLDLSMPGQTGLDVQEAVRRNGILLPVVFFSGQGDVPAAAKAMRDGAVDFLVKPLDERDLLNAIGRAFAQAADLQQRRRIERETAARLARLTKRERQVCDLVARVFSTSRSHSSWVRARRP
jgi:FixJ family two-component response regulator